MVDMAALVARVRGMLVSPEQTLEAHVRPVPPWTVVAREHALPLIVGCGVASSLLVLVFPSETAPLGLAQVLTGLVIGISMNFVGLMLIAWVVSRLSGMFGGRRDFAAGFTLMALSMTPAYLGEVVLPLPGIGFVGFIAGIVYAFVLYFRGIPIALGVLPDHRGKMLILTILAMMVMSMMFGSLVAGMLMSGG